MSALPSMPPALYDPVPPCPKAREEALTETLLADETWLRNALEYIDPAAINNVVLLMSDPCEYAHQLKQALQDYAIERAQWWVKEHPCSPVSKAQPLQVLKGGYVVNAI